MPSDDQEVTLAVLGEKLDNLHKDFVTHIAKEEEILLGSQGRPGLVLTVDRLDQAEQSRVWYFRAIWVAIIGLFAKVLWSVK